MSMRNRNRMLLTLRGTFAVASTVSVDIDMKLLSSIINK